MNGKPGVLASVAAELDKQGCVLSPDECEAAMSLIEKAEAVVWKLTRNDEGGPAKIDRNDVVIRQLSAALAAFRGEQP